MTQPLAQIGQNLLLELVKINTKRNQQKAQSMNFLQQEQMFQEFSRLGLEDWQDLYTESDITNFFTNFVVVLNHNERHTFDNIFSATPVSSGYHIGASCWLLEIAHLRLSVVTNVSLGLDYRHPMPFQSNQLLNTDCMLLSSVAVENLPMFDDQI